MMKWLHGLMDTPAVYTFVQAAIAPGAEKRLITALKHLTRRLPQPGRLLDLGCGPSSRLWKLGWQPVGLDLSYPYARTFLKQGRTAVAGSCCALPFADQSFDGVWTIGVLHHLDDAQARQTVDEMLRVCRPDGYVVAMDAVLPEPAWQKPLAYLIRKMDRGSHMRTQKQLEALLPAAVRLSVRRYTYSLSGLEMLECVCKPGI